MKKIILLGLLLVATLVSLGGCVWVEPWHGGHHHGYRYGDDDRYRYDHDRHYYDRYHNFSDRGERYYELR